MARWGLLLQCVAESVASQGLPGLIGMVPFGQVLYEVGQGVVERYSKKVQRAEEVACLQEMVVQSHAAIRAEVESRYESIVQNVPESVRAEIQKPEVRARVVAYAAQVPASFRASLRRPEDPTGSTVPKTLTISQTNDVFRFLPQRPPRFQPGDRPIGNWKLTDCLGIGGFGEVWKAEHHAIPGLVMALKFCLSPESKKSLVNESHLLGRIMSLGQREGIVALRNAHLDIETPCLEYDYINGGDLSGIFATWPSWNTEQKHKHALQFLKRLAQIVAPLHAMTPPIVHRDLKPANVMLSQINGKLEVQITDFGIGAIMAESALAEHRSGMSGKGAQVSQSVIGSHTPLYASPEQGLGADPDPRDDVHALGVIGYQLLVGNLMKAPSVDFADDLEEEHVAPPIIDLIKKCVATRRERRLPNAGALVVELNKALEARPGPVPPPEPPPAPKPAPRIGETIEVPLTSSIKMTCAWVPSGESWLGGGGGTEGETPFAFEKGLWCGIYPVTQEQWQAVMGSNPSHFKGKAKNPVEQVSYNDIQQFLKKVNAANSRSGFLYRLPTADEWEYILRGGPIPKSQSQYHYYFARSKTDLTDVHTNDLSSTQANFDGKYPAGSGKKGPYLESTSAVGNYLPNPLGMYDMHGNVWEWTSTEEGSDRVRCGGSWFHFGTSCEASLRLRYVPVTRNNYLGFRLLAVPVGG
jgi:formylglycine-generating enzyme required for sulfatase activity